MNGKYLVIIVVLVLGLGLLLFKDQLFPSSSSTQSSPEVTTTVTPTLTTSMEASPTAQPEETMVTLTTSGYSPASLTVKVGEEITFINKSGKSAAVNSDPHPVHSVYPPLNLGGFKDGETLTFTFDKAGTYGYHNHLNTAQRGTIVVE